MGFFACGVAGVGFILIGFWEFIHSLNLTRNPNPSPSSSLATQIKPTSISKTKENPFPSPSPSPSSSFILVSIFSLSIILNSVVSIFDAFSSKDRVGSMLQLQVLSLALLFLLYSALGLLNNKKGTWFVQMGFSFYTNLMVHGCSLHEKSRGNYTIKCKGHPEYHRARAIATLQFNCHLALLVVLVVWMLSIISKRNGVAVGITEDGLRYRPLGAEMQPMDNNVGSFTLDSDDDLDSGIKEQDDLVKEKPATVELSVNDHGSHV
ncbi:hypothetical protein like AT3G01360 [Hibiscus trionum]|uniref:Transmembrane protein n=1 Tax=Hibiscus trionum TaxID=183268 RepID=A0A9W7I2F7_HIBTR|nr:hypothetical protein like AT3G01360 [Hibiscus trionum]